MTFRVLCALLLSASLAQAGPIRAGAATSNITPPLGEPIIGGFVPFPATHIHDELNARCLVLDDGTTKLAIVVCDLLGVHYLVSEEARALIQKDLGIPPDNILISGTHTHSACSALGKNSRSVNATMDEYQRFVARRIVDGVKRAHNRLAPAKLGWGSIEVPDHLFNRRWFMKPGTVPANPFGVVDKVKMNPPGGSADLVEPAGPIDPELPILSVRHADGKPLAVFCTYSLHYVGGVGSGHISADYFGVFCDALGKKLDPECVVLLANGTSGDINNNNFKSPRPRMKEYEQMQHVAFDLVGKVQGALEKVDHQSDVNLAARYREPAIGTRRVDAETMAWAKKLLAEPAQKTAKADLPRIYAERTLRMAEHPETLKIPLQVFRIGDRVVGTMPCEIFCEIGLDFKKRSPIRPAFLVSLAHGYFGYLPTPRQHELGGYETWLGTNRLEKQASEKMLDILLELTGSLKQ